MMLKVILLQCLVGIDWTTFCVRRPGDLDLPGHIVVHAWHRYTHTMPRIYDVYSWYVSDRMPALLDCTHAVTHAMHMRDSIIHMLCVFMHLASLLLTSLSCRCDSRAISLRQMWNDSLRQVWSCGHVIAQAGALACYGAAAIAHVHPFMLLMRLKLLALAA
eukprot:2690888-Pleurochrysis_carterae.AAC.1